jgi:hypothetical protein
VHKIKWQPLKKSGGYPLGESPLPSDLIPDRGDVLGADVASRVDPDRGDAGAAKVVFCEGFVARWLAHTRGKQWLRDVKSPAASEHGKLKTAGPRPAVAGGDNRARKINRKAHCMFLRHAVASEFQS